MTTTRGRTAPRSYSVAGAGPARRRRSRSVRGRSRSARTRSCDLVLDDPQGLATARRARDHARRHPRQGPRLDERHVVAGHARRRGRGPCRCHHQVRQHAGADRRGRRAVAATERSRSLRRDGGAECRDARAVRGARDGVAERRDGADRRRVRHRQGARGARDPRRVGARGRAVRRRRLQRDRREPDRLAPVRPRARARSPAPSAIARARSSRRRGGTLFLDELGELPLAAQAKLLRVLEAQTVQPVGADRPVKVDTRVVAATHRDLSRMVAAKEFRFDLFYRLAVVHVALPPLRDRLEDLPHLIATFYRAARRSSPGRSTATTSSAAPLRVAGQRARAAQRARARVGAVGPEREVPRAAAVARSGGGRAAARRGRRHVAAVQGSEGALERSLRAPLRRRWCSRRTRSNVTRAAEHAGLSRRHFRELLYKHGIVERPADDADDAD